VTPCEVMNAAVTARAAALQLQHLSVCMHLRAKRQCCCACTTEQYNELGLQPAMQGKGARALHVCYSHEWHALLFSPSHRLLLFLHSSCTSTWRSRFLAAPDLTASCTAASLRVDRGMTDGSLRSVQLLPTCVS
jgi:hypothetical protein